jgi:hypothetical protein
MPREIAVYGLLMPTLLPILIGVGALYWMLDSTLARFGVYQHVWHPPLFRLSFFVCLFVIVATLLGQ